MKKIIFTIVVSYLIISSGYSQEHSRANQLSFELGGAGLATSVNFERAVFRIGESRIVPKVGLGYLPVFVNGSFSTGTFSLIAGANYIRGYKNHQAVLGVSNSIAASFVSGLGDSFSSSSYSYLAVPNIGYRYIISEKRNLFVGAGYSPIISFSGFSIEKQPMQYKNHFYLTVGFALK
ncbi:MAG: hypothetical protein ACLFNU_10155 [Bacteroidales bacterium]